MTCATLAAPSCRPLHTLRDWGFSPQAPTRSLTRVAQNIELSFERWPLVIARFLGPPSDEELRAYLNELKANLESSLALG